MAVRSRRKIGIKLLIPAVTETGVDLANLDLLRNTQCVIEGLDWVHLSSGLPWWGTIVGVTVALRMCMLPLAVKTIRNGVALAHAQPPRSRPPWLLRPRLLLCPRAALRGRRWVLRRGGSASSCSSRGRRSSCCHDAYGRGVS